MTVHNEFMALTVAAAEDLSTAASRFKAVTIAGTIMAANPAAGVSGRAIGINVGACRSGDNASIAYRGIVEVVAGTAITTAGYPAMVGSSGFVFAAASGFSHCGRFLDSCASGALVRALVDFSTFPLWSGV